MPVANNQLIQKLANTDLLLNLVYESSKVDYIPSLYIYILIS